LFAFSAFGTPRAFSSQNFPCLLLSQSVVSKNLEEPSTRNDRT
jgi:hypothetical protein